MPEPQTNIYKTALDESVHFSVKTINSNIEKFGIRLASNQALDLPYLSARTLLHENFLIPTDYLANSGKTASIFKVVKAAQLDEDLSAEETEFQQQVKQLKPAIAAVFARSYQAGTEDIDVRMRQLLIPKNGEYISLSPLTAAGVNYLINQEVDLVNTLRKEKDSLFNRIQTAVFGIGGAKALNVGSHAGSMRRPITLSAPQASETVRRAFSIFYHGFKIRLLRRIKLRGATKRAHLALKEWSDILNRQLYITAHNNIQNWHDLEIFAPSTNMLVREQEIIFLRMIIDDVLNQARYQKNILEQAEAILPSLEQLERQSFWLHPSLSLLIHGLIDPKLRDDHWRVMFAADLARRITQGSFSIETGQEMVSISLDNNAEGYLARRLAEMMR